MILYYTWEGYFDGRRLRYIAEIDVDLLDNIGSEIQKIKDIVNNETRSEAMSPMGLALDLADLNGVTVTCEEAEAKPQRWQMQRDVKGNMDFWELRN